MFTEHFLVCRYVETRISGNWRTTEYRRARTSGYHCSGKWPFGRQINIITCGQNHPNYWISPRVFQDIFEKRYISIYFAAKQPANWIPPTYDTCIGQISRIIMLLLLRKRRLCKAKLVKKKVRISVPMYVRLLSNSKAPYARSWYV